MPGRNIRIGVCLVYGNILSDRFEIAFQIPYFGSGELSCSVLFDIPIALDQLSYFGFVMIAISNYLFPLRTH